jgi:alkylation response protein AidB-like acyl-CoA dehydrogenase
LSPEDPAVSDSLIARELGKISEKDRRQIEEAQDMLGPDPLTLGVVKSYFWGRVREDLLFCCPAVDPQETERCDRLLEELDAYLRDEHPHFEIDREQSIPQWCIDRLFAMGVMGMIIPPEYGGGGFGITSYNRVLERIGASCPSTAVLVSAHQSIGCGAIKLFGSDDQKRRYLPGMGRDTLSAFCLSEPNVGCDAGGQESRCTLSDDGRHYILNGEKKWATSGALAGLFTVMAKQRMTDPDTGKLKDRVTALICTPDMEGVEIFSRNRSKCGIRGTWQARIRFTDVRVPKENLLHLEGHGLKVALTCLDYGRCTLSAGMLGAARAAYHQSVKWAQFRYQFQRPLAEFEQVQAMIAETAACVYAMDSMLYMTTGMLDRGDPDIMLETAACKVFCSEMGFRAVDRAIQIMGGEGYITANRVERLWRDSRINTIVEGANEVMHSFVFGYGVRGLSEQLMAIRSQPLSNPALALQLAAELYLGMRAPMQHITALRPELDGMRRRIEPRVRELSHQSKRMLKVHREAVFTRQMVHQRLSWAAVWIHAALCVMARFEQTLQRGNVRDAERERPVAEHAVAMACEAIDDALRRLERNTDETMRRAAAAALDDSSRRPNADYVIPERTPDPDALGSGWEADPDQLPRFGEGSVYGRSDSAA